MKHIFRFSYFIEYKILFQNIKFKFLNVLMFIILIV